MKMSLGIGFGDTNADLAQEWDLTLKNGESRQRRANLT
jgi:hypothetical protein